MSRRVVIGQQVGGDYGLRVSMPSYDALTDTNNGSNISFDSSWTDLTQALQVGTATKTSSGVNALAINFTNQGYIPFVEIRVVSGAVLADDGVFSVQYGLGATVTLSQIFPGILASGASVIYAIYKVQVMSG